MKQLLFLSSLMLLAWGCDRKPIPKVEASALTTTSSSADADDFSDLAKKDDESCSSEEEVQKKLVEKPATEFKLQGNTDPDCQVQ